MHLQAEAAAPSNPYSTSAATFNPALHVRLPNTACSPSHEMKFIIAIIFICWDSVTCRLLLDPMVLWGEYRNLFGRER
jgi:hypothetical protein